MRKVIYAATPFRMKDLKERICDFIQERGHFPLHPFNALPMSRYRYSNFTREEIMRVCYGLVELSDELWIFGLGSGSFDEWLKAKDIEIPRKSFVKVFDPKWEEYSQKVKYKSRYPGLLKEILTP